MPAFKGTGPKGLLPKPANSTALNSLHSPRLRVTFGLLPVAQLGLRRYVSFMSSQEDLVRHLVRGKWLKTDRCIEAFRKVDRRNYIADSVPGTLAYLDRPLPNGPFETISAPHMHATALEVLSKRLRPGARVLDVGSGSGFLTACFAYACQPNGYVLGIEKHCDLVAGSVENMRKADGALLDSGIVELRCGNVLAEAEAAGLAFDAIHVGAAAETLPRGLCKMLKPGGLMMVPVGAQGESQVLTLVERSSDPEDDGFVTEELMHVQYVPLTEPE